MNSAQNQDGSEGGWLLEFESYPAVDESHITWSVTNKNTNSQTTLSLGESTNDHIFSSDPKLETFEVDEFTKSSKQRVALQIHPHYDKTNGNGGDDLSFKVEFKIKVYTRKCPMISSQYGQF